MSDWGLVIDLTILFGLFFLGVVLGSLIAAAHRRSLSRREEELADILISNQRRTPLVVDAAVTPALVRGEVVLGCDHFRRLLGSLRGIIGGEVRTYTALVERCRREALLRLKQEARDQGYDLVINIRLDTSTISAKAHVMVEVLATGTALRRAPGHDSIN